MRSISEDYEVLVGMKKEVPSRPMEKCVLHPLIHTRLEFDLVQEVDYGQRFPGLGSEPPQTGQSFSVGLIIRLALHLGHLAVWSLTRLISL
jgi:hypothetical protein